MWNEIKTFFRKQWLSLWIVLAIGILIPTIASAEYTVNQTVMNRVVVSANEQGMMFSSNYLVENGNNVYVAKYVKKSDDYYDIDVYLWNYNLDNISRWYSKDINYQVSAELTDSTGTALTAEGIGERAVELYVDKEDGAGYSKFATLNSEKLSDNSFYYCLKYNQTKPAEHIIRIRYPIGWNLADTGICVRLTAEPVKRDFGNVPYTGQYDDLKPISAILGLKEALSGGSRGWQAYISEQQSGKEIADCDGYNVIVTGSGEGKITLEWDPEYLGINPYFYDGEKKVYSFGTDEVEYTAGSGDSMAKIVINANTGSTQEGHSQRNRYDIQLYKTGVAEPASWAENVAAKPGQTVVWSVSGNVWFRITVE